MIMSQDRNVRMAFFFHLKQPAYVQFPGKFVFMADGTGSAVIGLDEYTERRLGPPHACLTEKKLAPGSLRNIKQQKHTLCYQHIPYYM